MSKAIPHSAPEGRSRSGLTPRLVLLAGLALPFSLFAPIAPLTLWSAPAMAQQAGTLSGPTFVEAAGIGGLFEVETGKLALKKSDNPDIRTFAERIVGEHQRILADLKGAAATADGQIAVPAALDTKHETMLERLSTANGADFDTLFVQMQTEAHEAAVGIFSAFEKDGDQSALKAFAARTLPMLKEHLEAIKRLQIKT